MAQNFTIAVLDAQHLIWRTVANISNNKINIEFPSTESVKLLSEKICERICMYENQGYFTDFKSNPAIIVGEPHDILYFTFIDSIKYRRGTVYWGIQYSINTKQTRILAYGTNRIHHSGFGTNPLDDTDSITKNIERINMKDLSAYDIPNEAIIAIRKDIHYIGI
ncbi:Hypothetical protein HVR_LOCUS733 [uncultured virus]|nr:Hypothetical protein HVR_LOCUS733 [uncultured virus]